MRSHVARHRDQADGLRRLFESSRPIVVPVVSNPYIAFGGVMLERIATAFGERGATTLVVDAAERAAEPGEMARVDLAQCVETLAPDTLYLAARGLPIAHVDAHGSTRGFLRAVADAAPRAGVVVVHAAATELSRLFAPPRVGDAPSVAGAHELICPIVLADDQPSSVTHAYAAMKLLARRAQLSVFDVLLGAAAASPRADRIVQQLGACADRFFGAAIRHAARVDPTDEASAPANAALAGLAALRLPRVAPRARAPRSSHVSRPSTGPTFA